MANQGDFLDEDDFSSDSATKVASQQSIKKYVDDNANEWQSFTPTVTRTGDHIFTVSGDYTATFRPGTRVKYDDGAVDYGVVGTSSEAGGTTTVTLLTNDDYAMAAASITNVYYSDIMSPSGFPESFSFTPAFTSVTIGNGTLFAEWVCFGNTVSITFMFELGSTSSLTNPTFTAIGTYVNTGYGNVMGFAACLNAGVAYYPAQVRQVGTNDLRFVVFDASATYATQQAITNSSVPFSWGTGDILNGFISYMIE